MAQRITVDIVAETAQLRAGLDQVNQQLGGLQAGVSKINQVTSAVAGIGVAAAGLSKATGFITQAAGAASDLQETTSKVGQIFGDAADEVLKFSQGTAKSIGQSSQQALDASATFGIFGKAAGLAGTDLTTFSTDFTVLASDLASFNNTSPQDAINALGSALRGESEPLRRYGVLLNEDALKAEALSLGLTKANVSTVKVELAQAKAQKAAEAYAKAVRESGEGSAAAAEKGALLEKANLDLTKATSGISEKLTASQKILAAQSLIYKQTTDAQGDFTRTSDGLANSQRILEATQADLNTNLGKSFLPIMDQVTKVVQFAIDLFTKLPGPVQTFIVGLTLLIATLGPLIILINSVKTALVALEVAKIAASIASGGLTVATNLLSLAMRAIPILAIIGLIVLLVQNWDTVTDVVGKVLKAIGQFAKDAVKFIGDAVKGIGDALKNIGGFFVKAVDTIVDVFSIIPNKMLEIGANIVKGLWNGISGLTSWIKDKVTGFFGSLIPGWAKDILGIKSPSKVFAGIGQNIVQGLVGGLSGPVKVPSMVTPARVGASSGVNITINAGLGTDPYKLGREVNKAVSKYSRVSNKVVR